jgi:hypothetical protein
MRKFLAMFTALFFALTASNVMAHCGDAEMHADKEKKEKSDKDA